MDRDHDERIDAMAALGDPLRRALFRFVVRQDHPVGRDEAAVAIGVPRAVAAFHLDRLAAEGLLDTEYRRLTSRRGPGAGRPSKLYRPAVPEVGVSVPPRQYDLAADLLASAVSEATETGTAPAAALERVAHQRGSALARSAEASPGAQSEASDTLAMDALARAGYEPVLEGDEIVLVNCPFHALVADHTELVCGMNLALLEGFVDALSGEPRLAARLQPTARHCCVRLDGAGQSTKERLP